MIVLLDLNYTLVENSMDLSRKGWEYRQAHERYRQWLLDTINAMNPEAVVLITIRPRWQEEWTLGNILEKHGWRPDLSVFNGLGGNLSPPSFKRFAMREVVIPKYGDDPLRYLSVESNAETHKMYVDEFGIRGFKVFPHTERIDGVKPRAQAGREVGVRRQGNRLF